jgi:transcription initiation factor IIE alpha subunit
MREIELFYCKKCRVHYDASFDVGIKCPYCAKKLKENQITLKDVIKKIERINNDVSNGGKTS